MDGYLVTLSATQIRKTDEWMDRWLDGRYKEECKSRSDGLDVMDGQLATLAYGYIDAASIDRWADG